MNKRNSIILGVVLTLLTVLVVAQEKKNKEKSSSTAEPKMLTAAEMQWGEGPPSLPAGAQMVVLDGDPRQNGSFTIRLKMPAGYKIPPHTHPAAERVTVISGAVHLGIGEKFDESAGRELKAGDFAVIPAGVPHFAWSPREAVLQIHSEGPFQRTFVESKN
ncbi:MAG TPA: cupin domain-containing protein [Chthoniobacterales bacterium]|nr:cupin domain-containing protein [Chthoniobacterales bacterium]